MLKDVSWKVRFVLINHIRIKKLENPFAELSADRYDHDCIDL